jgi:hypothetical protein
LFVRKCPTGAGLEVFFEFNGLALFGEGKKCDELPGSKFGGMAGSAGVVGCETFLRIRG